MATRCLPGFGQKISGAQRACPDLQGRPLFILYYYGTETLNYGPNYLSMLTSLDKDLLASFRCLEQQKTVCRVNVYMIWFLDLTIMKMSRFLLHNTLII